MIKIIDQYLTCHSRKRRPSYQRRKKLIRKKRKPERGRRKRSRLHLPLHQVHRRVILPVLLNPQMKKISEMPVQNETGGRGKNQ